MADRFHVTRLITDDFLAFWRELDPAAAKNRGLLSHMRRHRQNLKPEQRDRLGEHSAQHPALARVYRFENYRLRVKVLCS